MEIPQTITSEAVPTTTLYFHKGPGKIAEANEPATSSQKNNDAFDSTDKYDFAPYTVYKAVEEKTQPTPTAAPRLQKTAKKNRPTATGGAQNRPGKTENGNTQEFPPPLKSAKKETKSKQASNPPPNVTTTQDAKISEQTVQDESESDADLEKGKFLSFSSMMSQNGGARLPHQSQKRSERGVRKTSEMV